MMNTTAAYGDGERHFATKDTKVTKNGNGAGLLRRRQTAGTRRQASTATKWRGGPSTCRNGVAVTQMSPLPSFVTFVSFVAKCRSPFAANRNRKGQRIMESKIECVSFRPISPVVDISESKPGPRGEGIPDVIVVFELDFGQYASVRGHFDHLIDAHGLSARVHFEEQT